MRLLREPTTSFAGGVNDSVAADEYLAHQAQVMLNVRPSPLGNSAEWMPWARRLSVGYNFQNDNNSSNVCYGAIEFYTSAGVQQIIAIFNDAAYCSLDGGRTFTQISGASGLEEEFWSFAIMTEGGVPKLCCANGGASAYQYDGTTWSTIANIPSGTKYLAIHGNRLIASGYEGAQVAASAVGNIDVWATPQGWVVNADDGSDGAEVTGLYSLGGVILVFKRRSFGYTEGYGYQTLQVAAGARGISRSIGCVAHRTIQPAGENAIMFLSEQGFVFYALGQPPALVSSLQRRFVEKINYEAIRQFPGVPTAMWVAHRQEYWCAVPVANAAGTDEGYTRNSWTYVYRPATAERPAAAFMRYPTLATHRTLTIDATTGELDITDEGDLTGYMGFVDESGALDVCRLPDAGLWVQLSTSALDLALPIDGPSAYFTADSGPVSAAAFAGTYACGISQMEMPQAPIGAFELVRDGDLATDDEWTANSVTIAGGTATWPGTAGLFSLMQFAPYEPARTYRISFRVTGRTKGTVYAIIGPTTGGTVTATANGVFSGTVTPISGLGISSPSSLQFWNNQDDEFDGAVSEISVVDVTGDDEVIQTGILRTRPLTFGDEFTRKKAKRITVASSQPLAHTATIYPLVDGVYGTAHSTDFAAALAGQERRVRVGGRARVLQTEVHLSAECVVDGIEMVAQPLGDQI